MKLTPKQIRFVDEWLIDFNGKQAAIRAGYSAKTAEAAAAVRPYRARTRYGCCWKRRRDHEWICLYLPT